MGAYPLFEMIQSLRTYEEITLSSFTTKTTLQDDAKLVEYLQQEFEKESMDFPSISVQFNDEAALWAAKLIFYASQLVLFRNQSIQQVQRYFQPFVGQKSDSSILSVDLCLRFLPDLIRCLGNLDMEDELIPILEKLLIQWHYSGIHYELNVDEIHFDDMQVSSKFLQMYSSRVIEYKRSVLANHPVLRPFVLANLGYYKNLFWKSLIITEPTYE